MFSIRSNRNMMNYLKGLPYNYGLYNLGSIKYYKQVKDLTEITYTAEAEYIQRSEKYMEYTTKIYKPSRTITFDRNGEVLLFSCDNFKNSQVYLKYPYIMYDCILPLSLYNLICDPLSTSWIVRSGFLYFSAIFGWLPHLAYVRALMKKIHKIYLMRGGKYCRVTCMNFWSEQKNSWITIKEINLLSKDYKRFEEEQNADFLNTEGQLKYELGVQMDSFNIYNTMQNDEVIYFMKEGCVHEPELFEMVMKGYHIDTSDCEINTEDNTRWLEPNKNY